MLLTNLSLIHYFYNTKSTSLNVIWLRLHVSCFVLVENALNGREKSKKHSCDNLKILTLTQTCVHTVCQMQHIQHI